MTAFTRVALTGLAATGLALGAAATGAGAATPELTSPGYGPMYGPKMGRAAYGSPAPAAETGQPEAHADLAQGVIPESKGWVVVPKSRQYVSADTAPSPDKVRAMLQEQLDRRGNERLEVGEIRRTDGGTVVAEIVTRAGEVVETVEFDGNTGWADDIQ